MHRNHSFFYEVLKLTENKNPTILEIDQLVKYDDVNVIFLLYYSMNKNNHDIIMTLLNNYSICYEHIYEIFICFIRLNRYDLINLIIDKCDIVIPSQKYYWILSNDIMSNNIDFGYLLLIFKEKINLKKYVEIFGINVCNYTISSYCENYDIIKMYLSLNSSLHDNFLVKLWVIAMDKQNFHFVKLLTEHVPYYHTKFPNTLSVLNIIIQNYGWDIFNELSLGNYIGFIKNNETFEIFKLFMSNVKHTFSYNEYFFIHVTRLCDDDDLTENVMKYLLNYGCISNTDTFLNTLTEMYFNNRISKSFFKTASKFFDLKIIRKDLISTAKNDVESNSNNYFFDVYSFLNGFFNNLNTDENICMQIYYACINNDEGKLTEIITNSCKTQSKIGCFLNIITENYINYKKFIRKIQNTHIRNSLLWTESLTHYDYLTCDDYYVFLEDIDLDATKKHIQHNLDKHFRYCGRCKINKLFISEYDEINNLFDSDWIMKRIEYCLNNIDMFYEKGNHNFENNKLIDKLKKIVSETKNTFIIGGTGMISFLNIFDTENDSLALLLLQNNSDISSYEILFKHLLKKGKIIYTWPYVYSLITRKN